MRAPLDAMVVEETSKLNIETSLSEKTEEMSSLEMKGIQKIVRQLRNQEIDHAFIPLTTPEETEKLNRIPLQLIDKIVSELLTDGTFAGVSKGTFIPGFAQFEQESNISPSSDEESQAREIL